MRVHEPTAGANNGGYLGLGSSRRGAQNRSARDFFERRDDVQLVRALAAPLGLPPKTEPESKPQKNNDDQERSGGRTFSLAAYAVNFRWPLTHPTASG